MKHQDDLKDAARQIMDSMLVSVTVALLLIILLGWGQNLMLFGPFHFVVSRSVRATGISIYLIKGILIIVLIPFFLTLRGIGGIPSPGFKSSWRQAKTIALGVVFLYIFAYFLSVYVAGGIPAFQ